MEDVRSILVKIYEDASGKKSPQHPILMQRQDLENEINVIDEAKREANQILITIKKQLEDREHQIQEANGRPVPEIAILSQDIRNSFAMLEKKIEQIEQQRDKFAPNAKNVNPEEAKKNFQELDEFVKKIKESRDKMKQWEISREKKQSNQLNPLMKLSDQKLKDNSGKTQKTIENTVLENQSLDDLLPDLGTFDEAVQKVKQQDEELESKAARMLEKVGTIKQQVLKHKEILDVQDEILEDINKNVNSAKDDIKKLNVTATDIRKRLMKGSTCLVVAIIIAICCIGVYWIFKLAM